MTSSKQPTDRASALPTDAIAPAWRPDGCGRIALVLQGGGALGAYQAGVYEALHEAGIEPDYLSGVSIGAINAAIIVGNARDKRIAKLRAFWERVTSRRPWLFAPEGDLFRKARNATSSLFTSVMGAPGFFEPRAINPWFAFPGAKDATSYYDTAPLRETLCDLIDFEQIQTCRHRLAVGAVNVRSGNFTYFDNGQAPIDVEHIMASSALPPAFPAVTIGTDQFWDGGVVSNTPLQHLLDGNGTQNTLAFQVDLFSARGPLPRSIGDVASRQKDIQYSSRTRFVTDSYKRLLDWKMRTLVLLERLPDNDLTDEDKALRDSLRALPSVTILQLIYQQRVYEGEARDYEFSTESMLDHWRSGLEDTRRTLRHKEWLAMPPRGVGLVSHDVHRDA